MTTPRSPTVGALAPSVYLRNDEDGTLAGRLIVMPPPSANPVHFQVTSVLTVTNTQMEFGGHVLARAGVYVLRKTGGFTSGGVPLVGDIVSNSPDETINTFPTDPVSSGHFTPPWSGVYRITLRLKAPGQSVSFWFGTWSLGAHLADNGNGVYVFDEAVSLLAGTSFLLDFSSMATYDAVSFGAQYLGGL